MNRKKTPSWQQIAVYYESEITRIKEDVGSLNQRGQFKEQMSGFVGIVNATVLTMHTGNFEQDLLHEGVILLKDGQIHAVGSSSTAIPPRTHIIDAAGGLYLVSELFIYLKGCCRACSAWLR
jgi:hypothetical protein